MRQLAHCQAGGERASLLIFRIQVFWHQNFSAVLDGVGGGGDWGGQSVPGAGRLRLKRERPASSLHLLWLT